VRLPARKRATGHVAAVMVRSRAPKSPGRGPALCKHRRRRRRGRRRRGRRRRRRRRPAQ
jgi:hypothetical protein